jgi:hypothetical protein
MKRVLLLMAAASLGTAFGQGTTYIPVAEGSTTTPRLNVDGDSGQVYIYTGGFFPRGTVPRRFTFLWGFAGPAGNTTGYITPLLFEVVAGPDNPIYLVRSIGHGFPVSINSSPQTIPFAIAYGDTVTTNFAYTFGYVNAIVNSAGQEALMSSGTVEMDYPEDSGAGVGGAKTLNNWMATGDGGITVALGTTFGTSGADFPWVNYFPERTYSALAEGIVPTQ